jgi:hypothetical protein
VKEYRCTRNDPYSHQCIGHDDLTARQGYYIQAHSIEEAWQKMAIRFPEEVEAGFTVQEWEGFNVKVVEIRRDEEGNIIEIEQVGDGCTIEVKKDKEGNSIERVKRDKEGNIIEE